MSADRERPSPEMSGPSPFVIWAEAVGAVFEDIGETIMTPFTTMTPSRASPATPQREQ